MWAERRRSALAFLAVATPAIAAGAAGAGARPTPGSPNLAG